VTARLLLIMGMLTVLAARPAGAGPWSIEPRLGLEDDYTSNPFLSASDLQGEDRVAAIFDLPLRYDSDQLEFMLRPNGRITDRKGYSTLGSNSEHLDASGVYASGLSTTTVQAELARDSSLYYLGGLINRLGVARDTASTSADWTRALNERSAVELDASWMRVRYAEPADLDLLVDYRYWSAGPTFSYAMSERDTLKLLGGYGVYQSLNGLTESKSESLQLGFERQLTEIWTLSASGGYSRSMNSEKVYLFGFFFLGTAMSNQDSGVYSVTLTRRGERLNLKASVTQAQQPTGFAYLSRQDAVSIGATYMWSERWDFAVSGGWTKALTPLGTAGQAAPNGRDLDFHYLNAGLTANWHWTPQWIASLTVTKISQQYGPPTVSAASTNVALSVARQFLRTQF